MDITVGKCSSLRALYTLSFLYCYVRIIPLYPNLILNSRYETFSISFTASVAPFSMYRFLVSRFHCLLLIINNVIETFVRETDENCPYQQHVKWINSFLNSRWCSIHGYSGYIFFKIIIECMQKVIRNLEIEKKIEGVRWSLKDKRVIMTNPWMIGYPWIRMNSTLDLLERGLILSYCSSQS